MASTLLTIRSNSRVLAAAIAWLRAHDETVSEYVRDWLERGFKQWLVETAVIDPSLYAEIIAAVTDHANIDADALREQGNQALRATLIQVISGLGLRTASAEVHTSPGIDSGDEPCDTSIDLFYDPNDEEFTAL